MPPKFEPKIQALLCKWCASAGADLAGVSRLKYPHNIYPIRLICSGRLDPLFILRALEAGADGVFIGACHPGDCHYVDGNIKSRKRFDFFMKLLKELGLDDRVEWHYVSAAEGIKFQKVTTEFTEKIRKLGSSKFKNKKSLLEVNIDSESKKKPTTHDLLVELAKFLKIKIEEPIWIPEDEVMEGYGFPKRDPEKCVGCYACMSVCPDEIILVDDIKDKRVYSALHWGCMHCKKCEEVCPHEALKVVPGFEFKSYLESTPLPDIDRSLTQCNDCGVYFAAELHLIDLTNKISTGKMPRADIPKELMTVCPACRRKRVAQEVQTISITTPL